MRIEDMGDGHLSNSINMIYRGTDAAGRHVSAETRDKLPQLLKERDRRMNLDNIVELTPEMKEKLVKKNREYDLIDVRFAADPSKIYTYSVKKKAKPYLGQKLVVDNDRGTVIVFVVGINTGRTNNAEVIKEIKEKVVAL